MKKVINLTLYICCLLSIYATPAASAVAQTGTDDENIIRIFVNDGRIIDYAPESIDSITTNRNMQCIWSDGIYKTIDIASIDSVVYMSPVLHVATKRLDFGKVSLDSSKSLSIEITNRGKYPETFSVLADGTFSSPSTYQDFSIEAGKSRTVIFTYSPKEIGYDSAIGYISSTAISKGVLGIPLTGEGVGNSFEESPDIEETTIQTIQVELPADVDPVERGYKIVNAYGEYPLVNTANSEGRSPRKTATDDAANMCIPVDIEVSSSGLQLHFLLDGSFNPMLTFVTTPDPEILERVIDINNTAIALVMTHPLFITDDTADFNSMVKTIKGLDSFKEFRDKVEVEYLAAEKEFRCPAYYDLDIAPIVYELLEMYRSTTDLEKNGLELKVLSREGNTIKYNITSQLKRLVHVYDSRIRMDDSSKVPIAIEPDCTNLEDVIKMVRDELREYQTGLIGNPDMTGAYDDTIKAIEEELSDVENLIDCMAIWDTEFQELQEVKQEYKDFFKNGMPIPFALEPKTMSYFKIVYSTLLGDRSSIYETTSEDAEIDLKDDFDKMQVDCYGIGDLDKDWEEYSEEEQMKMLVVFCHSSYKDFIDPLISLVRGVVKVVNEVNNKNFKFDLRYGKRKYPELALVKKLTIDFMKDKKNVKKLADKIAHKKFLDATTMVSKFALKQIMKEPVNKEQDDPDFKNPEWRRTYWNLLYNIFKKYTKNYAIEAANRATFKAIVNGVTHYAGIAGATIAASESGMDVIGAGYAALRTDAKTTFIEDKSTEPYIRVTAPTEVFQKEPQGSVHCTWSIHLPSSGYGDKEYDFVVILTTPTETITTTLAHRLTNAEYDLVLGNIERVGEATSVSFQIIAYQAGSSVPYCTSEPYLVLERMPNNMEFVDLGLPSGNLWATCNIGAKQTYDDGNYFAWGETTGFAEGKTEFAWKNYKYSKGTSNSLTKYCSKNVYGYNGFTDELSVLQGTDDAVSSLYGNRFCIPTKEDWDELIRECRWSKFQNGVLLKSKNNGSVLFLPCAGYHQGVNLYDEGSEGYYWTSTLDVDSPDDAWFVYIGNGKANDYDYYRSSGRSIRPIMRNVNGSNAAKPMAPAKNQSAQPVEKVIEGGMMVKTTSGVAH